MLDKRIDNPCDFKSKYFMLYLLAKINIYMLRTYYKFADSFYLTKGN